jgi:hypothetical protein
MQQKYSVKSNSVYYSAREIFVGQGGEMSNTGRIAIDDNAVIRKFHRRLYIELGLTEYLLDIRFAVLDGELAVPCNLQPATAGSNS